MPQDTIETIANLDDEVLAAAFRKSETHRLLRVVIAHESSLALVMFLERLGAETKPPTPGDEQAQRVVRIAEAELNARIPPR